MKTMRFLLFLLLGVVMIGLGSSSLLADEIIDDMKTGTTTSGLTTIAGTGATRYQAYLDAKWDVAYLGAFEIGKANASTGGTTLATHDGVHVVGEQPLHDSYGRAPGTAGYQRTNYTLSNNTPLTTGTLAEACKTAAFSDAFIYNNGTWPVDGTSTWTDNTSGAPSWIGPQNPPGKTNVTTVPSDGYITSLPGYYAFRTDFKTTVPDEVEEGEKYSYLSMLLATDNALIAILLDGNVLDGNHWWFNGEQGRNGVTFSGTPYEFYLDISKLGIGDHTLTFIVNNYGWGATDSQPNRNPVGIYATGFVETNYNPNVPEPSSITLLGFGLMALLGVGYWRTKNSPSSPKH